MQEKFKFIEVSGKPYERGYQTGTVFRAVLRKNLAKYQEQLGDSNLYKQMKIIEGKVAHVFPDYHQEVCGRADGAGVERDLYFLLMCPELINEGVGCTTVVYRKPDGTYLLSHNEDDVDEPGNACLTKCHTSKGWFVTYDYFNMPFGNAFSWNSSGIVKTINYCFPHQENLTGIPRYFLQRHISEATSLEDFVQRCQISGRASGYHAIALDVRQNKAISVEVTANDFSIEEIDNYYLHTNHYLHPKICQGRVWVSPGSTSTFRLEKASSLLQGKLKNNTQPLSLAELKKILEYRGNDYEDSILAIQGEPNFTCANISLDTARKEEIYLEFYTTKEKMWITYL